VFNSYDTIPSFSK